MENVRNYDGNCFSILKYLAVLCVMCLHFTGYMRIYVPDQTMGLNALRSVIEFYQPTVVMLAISGFLVSASIERTGLNARLYAKKRFLRIYPELWISMAVYIIVLCSIVPELCDNSLAIWVLTQGIGIAATPSCMQGFATGSINGSLWFVTVIIQLYFLIFLFKYLTRNSKSKVVYGIVFAFLVISNVVAYIVSPELTITEQKLLERCFLPYAIWFFIGVLFQTFRLYEKKHSATFLVILIVIHLGVKFSGFIDHGYYTGLLSGILAAMITILVGNLSYERVYRRNLCRVAQKLRKADISYGMYLYHWLFINILIHYKIYERVHWIICLVLFIVLTCVVAFACHKISVKIVYKVHSYMIPLNNLKRRCIR
ncbi:acyltransferase family protein [Butyrivibrio sp. TB]|uniref:acyltransferase family protein n=1 Tax=Butyrivibrio sp. TB TaxID=1520809 RepID=UPI0008C0AAF4|nr:acyltransferase [Butyrivibrio sp. TB]SEQ36531.1 Peptidoglycan/LPS O-acetylase OafA/YrhL, contains acyltransferase and SGNH-hydrolase domains [Butyrivibrio sp. TB]